MRLTKLGKLALAVALCLVLGLATTASATPVVVPGLTPGIYVNGAFLVGFVEDGPNHFTAASGGFGAEFTAIDDPAIGWSVNATNGTGAAVDVAVVFGPLANTDNIPAIQLASTSGVSLTDFGGAAGASVVPFDASGVVGFTLPQTVPPSIATNYTADLVNGSFVITNFWGTNPGFTHDGTPLTQVDAFAFAGLGDGSIPDIFFEVVAFTLSANDTTGLSGECSFVPVPPAVLLFGSGMLGMGLLGWRRRLN